MSTGPISSSIGGVTKNVLVATDGSGNVFAVHLLADLSGTPLGSSSNPLIISATSLPLPAGAADATTLAAVSSKLSTLIAIEQPYQGVVAMTVDAAQTAQRAVRVNCTTAGNVSLTYVDGSTDIVMVNVGLSYLAGAVTKVNSSGTTAVATYANMK